MASDIERYDRAIAEYLADILPRVVYAPTNRAAYTITKATKGSADSIPYPFISFYRDPSIPIDHSRYNNAAVRGDYRGIKSSTKGTYRTTNYQHSIPVTLTYQIDVWGVKSSEILTISQKLLLKLTTTNPVLVAPMDDEGTTGRFHILDVNLVDNSDIVSEEEQGRLYRHTVSFTLAAWIRSMEEEDTGLFTCPVIVVTNNI